MKSKPNIASKGVEVKETASKRSTIEIELHTEFEFAYYENATNVAMALVRSGYFVNMPRQESSSYKVKVYKYI